MQTERYDAAVVGSGIVGLACAYHLTQAGMKVAVFEKSARPVGASVRNFGMVWPVGQPAGEIRQIALESRRHWLEILEAAGIWHRRCGSLHLAYEEDEMAVLEEFAQLAPDLGYRTCLVTPEEAKGESPVIKTRNLVGAMLNREELCVFPREAIAGIAAFLAKLGVSFHWKTTATAIEDGAVVSGSRRFLATRIIVCPGDDLGTLFPDLLGDQDIRLCKLQMLRARPRKPGFEIGPHLCAGLTLGHYANFQVCPGLSVVQERFAREMPEYVKWGIHLLVSQHEDGWLTIGDSHEYSEAFDPFLSDYIEKLILSYLDIFLPVEQLEVMERWHGVYAKHFGKPYALLSPVENVAVLAGIGGTGMTLSFGLAAKVLRDLGWIGNPIKI